MKRFLLPIILYGLVAAHTARCDQVETMFGGATYHLPPWTDTSSAQHFTDKWSSDGRLIGTPIFAFRYVTDEPSNGSHANTTFVGQNSVGDWMTGYVHTDGIKYGNWYLGGALGGYFERQSPFSARGINIWGFPVLNGGDVIFIPIIGIEVDYKIPLSTNTYMKFDNLISPVLINALISFGVNL